MYPIQTQDTKVILLLNGEIDLSNADVSRGQVRGVLEQGKNLDINLEQVRYMDSSGVSVLIEAMQETQRLGLNLALVDVSEEVMQVLELAHLHTILPIQSQASTSIDDVFDSAPTREEPEDKIFDSLFSDDPFDALFGEAHSNTEDHPDIQTQQDSQPSTTPAEQDEIETTPTKPSRNPFIG